jgi:hypothetical protein
MEDGEVVFTTLGAFQFHQRYPASRSVHLITDKVLLMRALCR